MAKIKLGNCFFKWADLENTKCEGFSSVELHSEWRPSQCLAVWSVSGRVVQIYTKNVFKHFLQGSYLKASACDTLLCLFPTFVVLLSKMAIMSLSVQGWLIPSVSDGYSLPLSQAVSLAYSLSNAYLWYAYHQNSQYLLYKEMSGNLLSDAFSSGISSHRPWTGGGGGSLCLLTSS